MNLVFDLFTNSSELRSFIISITAFVGVLWAIYRLVLERINQTALLIGIVIRDAEKPANPLTLINVTFKNISKVKLEAKYKKDSNGYTFIDHQDMLKFSSCIQVKKITWDESVEPSVLDWHTSSLLSSVMNLSEINLLQGYLSKDGTKTDFWMEPGEEVNLLCPVNLLPGDYLVKVIFVGNKRDADYWSQVVYFKKQVGEK
jgi:hypothetical protein